MSYTCGTARDLFPYLAQRTYLDTAAAGLCWPGHGPAVARFYDEVKSRGYDARPEWWGVIGKVRARIAAWLGVEPAAITFVSNTTEALNLVAHSLPLGQGARIVLAADEFPSVARIWHGAERSGAQVVRVPIPSESQRQAALLDALQPGTTLLAVSETHSSTGTTVDLDLLGRRCRELGALLIVDGIQAMGAVPTRLGMVDVYASSFFKWMLSGFGIGVLVTSAQARERMSAAWRGYANMDDDHQLQYAHVNIPAIYGLDATLDFFESVGWDAVFAQVHALGDTLFSAAEKHGVELATPRDAHAGIFVAPAANAETVRARLAERNISVSARGAGIRISPHFYNTAGEVEHCIAELARELASD